MKRIVGMVAGLMPRRIIRSIRAARIFSGFAAANGLVYMGAQALDDEGNGVRGFTVSTDARDLNVAAGSVGGHDLTIVRRSVVHPPRPHEHGGHEHGWLIGAVRLAGDFPDTLLLSHGHGRLIEEARHIRRHHERHVAIDSRLDQTFLTYSETSDSSQLRDIFTEQVIGLLMQHADYDFEVADGTAYVYDQAGTVTAGRLMALLRTSVALVDALASDKVDNGA